MPTSALTGGDAPWMTTYVLQAHVPAQPTAVVFEGDDNDRARRLDGNRRSRRGAHRRRPALDRPSVEADEREIGGHFETTPFDVVLLDLIGSPLDRSTICRRIKKSARGRSTPVIVSADAHTLSGRAELYEAGADDFISKPYRRTELLLRVGAMLRAGSLSRKLQDKTIELKSAKTLMRKQAMRLAAPPEGA